MDPTSQKAKEIFISLADKMPEQQWEEHLEKGCEGDDSLRQRVRALLRAHAEPKSFLESPAPALQATIDLPIAEKHGTVVDRYKLLEQIGEGGFGVVFMAEQEQPVRRKVALKIV